ncbi:Hypothetical predicted protein, partial [Pelobates cultripes]
WPTLTRQQIPDALGPNSQPYHKSPYRHLKRKLHGPISLPKLFVHTTDSNTQKEIIPMDQDAE